MRTLARWLCRFLGCLLLLAALMAWLIPDASPHPMPRFVPVCWGLFGVALFLPFRGRTRKSWRDDPASYRQRSFADELGIKYPHHITKGELSDLISAKTGR